MSRAPSLSLVFPVFDEEHNLDELLRSALTIGDRLARDFEIIVVDDGSRDASPHIIAHWCREYVRIRCVRHPRNGGYGAALRSGLTAARGELVFFSDADLQFDLTELEKLLEHTGDFDIVAGYRSPRRDPWPRLAMAATWGALVRLLFGLRVRDIDCAFKVFRRRVVESVPLASLGAFINTELLVRARARGFRIHQVPVSHRRRARGRQTGAHPRVLWRALVELSTLFRELRRIERREGTPKPGRASSAEPG
jgi:glycosyltransferase involved in cell wall biosynthesis